MCVYHGIYIYVYKIYTCTILFILYTIEVCNPTIKLWKPLNMSGSRALCPSLEIHHSRCGTKHQPQPIDGSNWSTKRLAARAVVSKESWLVVEPTLLKNMKVNWDDEIPNIWEYKKCSKPPTRKWDVSARKTIWEVCPRTWPLSINRLFVYPRIDSAIL